MDDKNILILLFNNNVLRTQLLSYAKYICNSDSASALLEKSAQYFSEPTKSLKVTLDDLDAIFTSEFTEDSDEYKLWQEIKNTSISDYDIVESAVIKHISKQLKEAFFAEAFTNDNYNLDKLEELYRLLDNIQHNSLAEDDQKTESIDLDDVDDCCTSYNTDTKEGVEFFDKRVSDTLSSHQFDCGTVNVVVGAPGHGKTQLILNQGVYVASTEKYTLHIALGDLTKRQLLLRILAIVTNKPINQIALLSKEQFKKFFIQSRESYPEVFKHFHSEVCLPNAFTGLELVRKIEEKQREKGVHYSQIVIDYDGNIETDLSSVAKTKSKADEQKSMYYAGADIYNTFVAFAKRNNSVVWILSQPKPQYWSMDKIPLEALTDSSKKGMIVDFCMSVGKKDLEEEECTFYISKNRHGQFPKSFKARQIGSTQRFEPPDWGAD